MKQNRSRYSMAAIAGLMTLLMATFWQTPALAGEDPIYTSLFSNKAAGGYDVTEYFTSGKPVKGSGSHETAYKGATWRFSSAENLAKFEADPEKYAPQYGGYCAWAAAKGDTQKGDPDHWEVYNGKLYLNYDSNIQKAWQEDRDGFITRADEKWPALLDN